jgi:hypothetical protein
MIHRCLFDIRNETQSRYGGNHEGKNPCTCRKSKSGLSTHSLFTALTELSADLLSYKVSAGPTVSKLILNRIKPEGLILDGRGCK